MTILSKKRQQEISVDGNIVMNIYKKACDQLGKNVVDRDLAIRLWDQRVFLGMNKSIPFGGEFLKCKSIDEVYWVAINICGIQETR